MAEIVKKVHSTTHLVYEYSLSECLFEIKTNIQHSRVADYAWHNNVHASQLTGIELQVELIPIYGT